MRFVTEYMTDSPSSLVLLSGGLDSAVLAADQARSWNAHPVDVAEGRAGESGEQEMIRQLLSEPPLAGRTQPLVRLEFTMNDVYAPTHSAVTGNTPRAD